MYYGKSYFIDDIVRYSPSTYSGNGLNYLISKSEIYHVLIETTPMEYSGQQSKLRIYSNNNYESDNKPSKTYYFTPKMFLKPSRRETPIINATDQIRELIEEAFALMLSKKLPQNISINVCTKEELKQMHSRFGSWSDGIQGFAINSKKLKQIFVKNSHLDELMLTIGHEIGHVYTGALANPTTRLAKDFQFPWER